MYPSLMGWLVAFVSAAAALVRWLGQM